MRYALLAKGASRTPAPAVKAESAKPYTLSEVLSMLLPFWMLLSAALPLGWILLQGGMDQVNIFAKASVFVGPVILLAIDIVSLHFRSKRPDFDPWSEI